MSRESPQQPTDAVLVYRTVRAGDLASAAQAVRASGVMCLPIWRPTAVPTGKVRAGLMVEGEGELRVPRRDVDRARAALRAHEDLAQQRIRAHLKDMPRQLRRGLLLAGLVGLLSFALAGGDRGVLLGLGIAWAVLGVIELVIRARTRATAPPARAPAPRWFGPPDGG